jgi:hypothetical protein
MEATRSSETSVHIWTTQRYIPQDGNFQGDAFSPLLSDLLWNMPLGRSKLKPGRTEIGMGHISFWSVLMMLIY